MGQTIRDVMSSDPVALDCGCSLEEAARAMRERDIGDVLVTKDGTLCGIVTDRDIVVRGLAEGRTSGTIGDIVSDELVTISPDDDIATAVELMRTKAIRRLPVVSHDRAVGIVTIGDLAVERDEASALASISGARPNR
jgi:CBS domain-containing protein